MLNFKFDVIYIYKVVEDLRRSSFMFLIYIQVLYALLCAFVWNKEEVVSFDTFPIKSSFLYTQEASSFILSSRGLFPLLFYYFFQLSVM